MALFDPTGLELLAVGSVKDIHVLEDAHGRGTRILGFRFTDDSSVKDYGKLPWTTPHKGEALCAMSVYNFEQLEARGIPTTFIEQIADDAIAVREVAVFDPETEPGAMPTHDVLVPIEWIIRNVITYTSSARKRLEAGDLTPRELGLSGMPEAYPVVLPKAFGDGSTKLRAGDDYLPWDQLCELCQLPVAQANAIDIMTRQINQYALGRGREVGYLPFDFKVEWALDSAGDLVLTDVPLAVDEITGAYIGRFGDLRELMHGGLDVFVPGKNHDPAAAVNASKQIYRDHYDAAEPGWVAALTTAKKAGVPKSQYPAAPGVPDELIHHGSTLFQALANAWCGRDVFPGVASLQQASEGYKQWAMGAYEVR